MAETTVQEQIVRENPEIEAYRLALLQKGTELAGTPVPVPAYQTAGISPYEMQAMQLAQQGIGSYQPYLDSATAAMGGATNAYSQISPLANRMAGLSMQAANGSGAMYDTNITQQYMNPYQQQVTQAALQEMNRQAAIDEQKLRAQQVARGSYGGSRSAIAEQEFNRNLMDIRSQRIFQDMANNYNQAQTAGMSAFEAAQGRQLQGLGLGIQGLQGAGNLYGSLGQAYGDIGTRMGNLGALGAQLGQEQSRYLATLGGVQREQAQRELDAQRATQQAQAYEPYQRLSFLSDLYSKTPSTQSTISTSTAPSASPIAAGLGTGIQALAAYKGFSNLFD